MQHRITLTLAAACALALPATAGAGLMGPLGPPAVELQTPNTDDVPPKDETKKDEVTVWVLEASGKG